MKPVRNRQVRTKLLPDGHIVLFCEQTDWAHTLSPLAGIAWEFCDGQNTVDEIVASVAQTAGLEASTSIREELAKLLDELLESGLLRQEAPTCPS